MLKKVKMINDVTKE